MPGAAPRRGLAAAALAAWLAALAASGVVAAPADPPAHGRVTARVSPEHPARLAGGGAVLDVEAASVDGPTELEMLPLDALELPLLDPGMTNLTAGGGGFRFGPHGARFLKHLRLTLSFDPGRLPPGTTEQDIHAFYYDETAGRWRALERVRVEAHKRSVVSLTDHFTDIIAATLVVPDHPEVTSFAPTVMKDFKAASPGQGLDLIQPPVPNPFGDARLSFPLALPPGRNGMQPSLALTYRSAAGNGWLGLGWSLEVAEIAVDARWGVPRYGVVPDAAGTLAYRDLETESYLLAGQALTPLAHRAAFAPRTAGPKTFHARVEGGFETIVRHGDDPAAFWWEVIDRNGTRSFYGEPPHLGGHGALRDDAGNVYRWALREVRDLNGNTLRFDYDLAHDAGIEGGTVAGRQIYLRAIHYTGATDAGGAYTSGPYTVRFLRDSDPTLAPWVRRPDVEIDCRGGFKQVTAERLRRIRVELGQTLVREYDLRYEAGAFGKTRLAAIEVRGADGRPFPGGTHRFRYHDEVSDAGGGYAGFAPEARWDVPGDGVTLCTDLGPVDLCPSLIVPDYDRASVLSGAITHGLGGHAYIGLNCGLPTKQNSAGLKVGFNHSRTEAHLGFLDVNGDQLPDKVFRSGAAFLYRANLGHPGGTPTFSAIARPLAGVDAISTETVSSTSGGAEAYFFGTTAIVNASHTLALGTTYTTDANGDQHLDIVHDGRILYGRPGPDGEPVFEPTSAHTPQPLAPGTLDGGGLIQDYEPLFQDLLDQNPLHDVFRRWLAPWDGEVRIGGDVRLAAPDETADGVRISVQHNETVLWSAAIPAGDVAPHAPAGLERVRVARGDRLYFRVQSVFDGAHDAVMWDPAIEYLDLSPARDANGFDPYRYRAADDFVLAGRPVLARMPYTGEVRITGTFEKRDTTSDDVELLVLRGGTAVSRTLLPWDTTAVVALDVPFAVSGDDTSTTDVDESDRVEVRLRVDSAVDARRLGWSAQAPLELVYESAVDTPVRDAAGNPLVRMLLNADMDLYPANALTAPQEPWVAPMDGTIAVRTRLGGTWSFRNRTVEQPLDHGVVAFSVKRAGARMAKRVLAVTDGVAGNATLGGIAVARGDRLFFDVSLREGIALGSVAAVIEYQPAGPEQPVPVALHTHYAFDDGTVLGRGLYGQPHRGWTCAGYDGNPARGSSERPHACTGVRVAPTHPLPEADLVIGDALLRAGARATPLAARKAVETQKAHPFSPAAERLANGGARIVWRGPDESGWVDAGHASATRLGVKVVGVPCPDDVGGGDGRAVPRIGVSLNAGAGVGFFIAVTGSVGRSRSDLDFLDLNGDQFPDVVGNGTAQFTLPDGGLEARTRALPLVDVTRDANNLAGSISIGGTVPVSKGGSRGTVGANHHSSPRSERVSNLMPSLGFSGELGGGRSTAQADLLDINGDGLADRVTADGTVALGLGYGFAPVETWPGLTGLDESTNVEGSLGAGLGFNDFIYGFAGGISYSWSRSRTRSTLLDLNGDGLVDRLREEDGTLRVAFNRGSGFAPEVAWQGAPLDAIATTVNATLGGGVYVTFGIPVFMCSPVTVLFLIVNPGVMASAGMARQEAGLIDVDGDRCADYVRSLRDDELIVHRNRTGRTNLLREVERPMGGRFTLDYDRHGNTPDMPQSLWALSRVELFDGVSGDGPGPLLTTIAYRAPRYDRGEREFYGFAGVTEEHRSAESPAVVYRAVHREHLNDSYYGRGLLTSETTRDGDGRPYRSVEYRHTFRDVATQGDVPLASRTARVQPLMVATVTRLHEGAPGAALASERRFEYDRHGNVTRVTDPGGAGPADDLEAEIEYAPCEARHVLARPSRIVVRANGATIAERHGTVDCETGRLTQVIARLDDGVAAVTDLAYHADGTLATVTGPPNLHGQRYARHYDYDPGTATHVTRVVDSHGLVSTAEYDLRFGRPLSTTDANGNSVTYAYDLFGRTTRVTGPYEHGTAATTIEFEYHPEAAVPWAGTRHLDVQRGPADPIETFLFTDGLGRVLQTQVDGTIHVAPNAPARDVRIASGRVRYDGFGRAAEQYQPVASGAAGPAAFDPTFDTVAPSRIAYDVLDRPVRAIAPDQSETRYAYALGADRDGATAHETTVTDANGNRQSFLRDARDLLVGVREGGAGGGLWTSYAYDALDRLRAVRDAHGNETRIEYDRLGRRSAVVRPDAGTTRFEHDPAGNLVAMRTANLIEANRAITYDYDFRRLMAVRYPSRPGNDVTYAYGAAGAPDNAAGRVVAITDAVGTEERAYGRLGEVVRVRRGIVGHAGWNRRTPQVYETSFRYDTWGRLLEIVYPDDEIVSYEYDAGGLVRRVTGREHGRVTEYARRIEYDAFQQQAFAEWGNGVRAIARYRAEDRRLERLETIAAAGPIQSLRYTYDPVGNLRTIANAVEVPPPSALGGPTLQRFHYDALYRLIRAEGEHAFAPGKTSAWTLDLEYDDLHNLRHATRTHEIEQPSGQRVLQRGTSFDHAYRYDSGRPHAPTHVGERSFSYDASGNQTGWTHDRNGTRRRIVWDDENRIQSVFVQGHEIRYAYAANGERMLRRGPGGEIATVNPFFTVRNRERATKHVLVGDTRIASRLVKAPPHGSGSPPSSDKDLYFLHPDHLGSVQFVTDWKGRVTQHLEYFPFGEVWVDQARGPPHADPVYSARELDPATDLYAFGPRDLDPRLGLFLSADPLSAAAPDAGANPAGLNVYSYAYGNPIRLVDPSGLSPGWWSRTRGTVASYVGAARTPAATPAPAAPGGMLAATDSPVRAASASGSGDFVAGAGVGVIGTGPPPEAGINTRRGPAPAAARVGSPAITGPASSQAAGAERSGASGMPEGQDTGFAGQRRPVVLGENMAGRVIPYAKSIGAETIVDWLAGREWSQQLNDDYIARIRAENLQVIDIGPDFGRRLRFKLEPPTDRGPRPVYESERQLLRGYANYQQVFVRSGKYGGGVPGIDIPAREGAGTAGIQP